MLSREVKPILGLIVLLAWPCLGWGGRAEAGFARGVVSQSVEKSKTSLGVEVRWALNEGEVGEEAKPEPAPSPAGMGHEPAPFAPSAPSRGPLLPRDLFPVAATPSNGMSSRGGPSTPTGWGSGLSFVLPTTFQVPDADPSGLMLPHDERLGPPLLAWRLFRPPR